MGLRKLIGMRTGPDAGLSSRMMGCWAAKLLVSEASEEGFLHRWPSRGCQDTLSELKQSHDSNIPSAWHLSKSRPCLLHFNIGISATSLVCKFAFCKTPTLDKTCTGDGHHCRTSTSISWTEKWKEYRSARLITDGESWISTKCMCLRCPGTSDCMP